MAPLSETTGLEVRDAGVAVQPFFLMHDLNNVSRGNRISLRSAKSADTSSLRQDAGAAQGTTGANSSRAKASSHKSFGAVGGSDSGATGAGGGGAGGGGAGGGTIASRFFRAAAAAEGSSAAGSKRSGVKGATDRRICESGPSVSTDNKSRSAARSAFKAHGRSFRSGKAGARSSKATGGMSAKGGMSMGRAAAAALAAVAAAAAAEDEDEAEEAADPDLDLEPELEECDVRFPAIAASPTSVIVAASLSSPKPAAATQGGAVQNSLNSPIPNSLPPAAALAATSDSSNRSSGSGSGSSALGNAASCPMPLPARASGGIAAPPAALVLPQVAGAPSNRPSHCDSPAAVASPRTGGGGGGALPSPTRNGASAFASPSMRSPIHPASGAGAGAGGDAGATAAAAADVGHGDLEDDGIPCMDYEAELMALVTGTPPPQMTSPFSGAAAAAPLGRSSTNGNGSLGPAAADARLLPTATGSHRLSSPALLPAAASLDGGGGSRSAVYGAAGGASSKARRSSMLAAASGVSASVIAGRTSVTGMPSYRGSENGGGSGGGAGGGSVAGAATSVSAGLPQLAVSGSFRASSSGVSNALAAGAVTYRGSDNGSSRLPTAGSGSGGVPAGGMSFRGSDNGSGSGGAGGGSSRLQLPGRGSEKGAPGSGTGFVGSGLGGGGGGSLSRLALSGGGGLGADVDYYTTAVNSPTGRSTAGQRLTLVPTADGPSGRASGNGGGGGGGYDNGGSRSLRVSSVNSGLPASGCPSPSFRGSISGAGTAGAAGPMALSPSPPPLLLPSVSQSLAAAPPPSALAVAAATIKGESPLAAALSNVDEAAALIGARLQRLQHQATLRQ